MRPPGATLVLLASVACAAPPPAPAPARGPSRPRVLADERIAAARATLERHPRLDPVWAELGEAWLDRARCTRDPADVRRAQQAFETSLALQPNFVALRGMTALACFRHRFEEALRWNDEAQRAYPEDTSVAAMRVEALLALGRIEEAERDLAGRPLPDGEVHLRAARARVLLARGEREAAEGLFLEAAARAEARAPALAAWALVRAAATRVDSGEPERARPLLAEALALDPESVDAAVHLIEVEEGSGELRAARERCEALLARVDDPFLEVVAARLARRTGDEAAARRCFAACEPRLRASLEAGEVYALGALVRLYLDAGERLDEAVALARRNAEALRTPEARALLAEAARAAG